LPSRAFVLFDIDGTLIRRAGPHHKRALIEAVRLVNGIEASLDHIPTQGMLDGDLFRMMLTEAGLPDTEILRALPALIDAAETYYLANCPESLAANVCPGVERLLEDLSASNIPAGLVTGNFSAIAWKKMELAGLRAHFRLGAFAEHGETRADLVREALERARAARLIEAGTRISLIGDHPNDIRAARAHAIQAIASATGLSPRDELAAEHPDILVSDLTELEVRQLC
jgi:phosphoglycolate phosphatase-like HAD superfamily hydrolase